MALDAQLLWQEIKYPFLISVFQSIEQYEYTNLFQICHAYLLLQMARGHRDRLLQVLYKQCDA